MSSAFIGVYLRLVLLWNFLRYILFFDPYRRESAFIGGSGLYLDYSARMPDAFTSLPQRS